MPRGSRSGSIIIVPAVKDARGRTIEPEKIYARRRYRDPKTGRLREKKRTAENRTDAKQKLQDLVNEIRHDKLEVINPAAGKTFTDLADYYELEYLHPPDKQGNGLRSWKKLKHPLQVLRDEFGDEPLSSIDYARLADFRKRFAATRTRHKTERSMASVHRVLALLRRLLSVARQRRWFSGDPFREGDPLIRLSKETKRMRILTHAEEKALLAQCKERRAHLRSALVFAIDTAARSGGQFSTRVRDVHLDQGYIRISDKTGPRIVPITKRLRKELLKLKPIRLHLQGRSTRHVDELIFDFERPKRSFAGACADAGIKDFRWHDLRHTGTMRMLEAGVDPATAMKVTGHTNWSTFLRYVNLNAELMRNVATKLDQSRSKKKRAKAA